MTISINSDIRGAAANSDRGGAAINTGDGGAAINTGDDGAASNTGHYGEASSTGKHGAASSTGYSGKVMGADGNALFLVHRNIDLKITHVWAGVAGQNGIKPDTWYQLDENGQPQECD